MFHFKKFERNIFPTVSNLYYTYVNFVSKAKNYLSKGVIIVVEAEYECENGLIGMGRDTMMRLMKILGGVHDSQSPVLKKKIKALFGIDKSVCEWNTTRLFQLVRRVSSPPSSDFFRLCKIFKTVFFFEDPPNIRSIMGMHRGLFVLKDSPFFKSMRPRTIPLAFIQNPTLGYTFVHPTQCIFGDESRTVFVERPFTVPQEVVQWKIRVEYREGYSHLCIGAAAANALDSCVASDLGRSVGSFSFCFRRNAGRLDSLLLGTADGPFGMGMPVPDRATVAVELIGGYRMNFFVNDVQVPHAITDLPNDVPIYLGVSGRGGGVSFTSLSLRRLRRATRGLWPMGVRNHPAARLSPSPALAPPTALTAEDRRKIAQVMEVTGAGQQVAEEMFLVCERNVENTISLVLGM